MLFGCRKAILAAFYNAESNNIWHLERRSGKAVPHFQLNSGPTCPAYRRAYAVGVTSRSQWDSRYGDRLELTQSRGTERRA